MQVTVLDDDGKELFVHQAPVTSNDLPMPEERLVIVSVREAILDALEYLDDVTGRNGTDEV